MITTTAPDIGGPAPALPAELAGLLHRMRLPHMRRAAPEVLVPVGSGMIEGCPTSPRAR